MTNFHRLSNLGQSTWCDYIRRSFITSGDLQALVTDGIRGVTSNPAIFEKAIAGSSDYDEDIQRLVKAGKTINEIYETLAIDDISRAADILLPLYDQTKGEDGFVSLEVSPSLAHNTQGTIAEAKRLYKILGRKNVMIKVPATPEGIPVITELISSGININVTLIFGNDVYKAVADAYVSGLEKLKTSGGDVSKVASVASFFISRIDSMVDAALAAIGNEALQGKIAIANAKMSFQLFREIVESDRWKKLAHAGARPQRLLWASTGTKNPKYPDTLYVDELIGGPTVNTMPPATLNAFRDHGTVATTLDKGIGEARDRLLQLSKLGIDLGTITKTLLDEGVEAFAKPFEALMKSIADKRQRLLAGRITYAVSLGKYQPAVDSALAELKTSRVMSRIWTHDYTLWKSEPQEITNRLGWLHSPDVMVDALPKISSFVDAVRTAGYTQAVLLGMGGSSLAPEVFRKTFGVKEGFLDLRVLDSTDPGAVLATEKSLDLRKTLFIVSTKSGGTVETFSFFRYFYNRVVATVGNERAGNHFAAITDVGSDLANVAKDHNFRTTFLNDPNIGGRYSALSYFGLVPAALIGVDIATILERASAMVSNCDGCNCPIDGDNAGAWLGVMIGELAVAGKDKITFVSSPPISSFGSWAEQLIAESTGKEGKGILPVDGEPLGAPEVYANDRIFAYLRLEGDNTYDQQIKTLSAAGHPVIQLHLNDLYDLGGEFFRWEMATVVAGRRLGINPFDQPNVESAKVLARKMVSTYYEKGTLPSLEPTLRSNGIAVYSNKNSQTLADSFSNFFSSMKEGVSYVVLQAYVQPSSSVDTALLSLRKEIRDRLKVATTVGYGPRFLHSTGQLHKGDAGNGLFIQFTGNMPSDVAIPDVAGKEKSSMTFGVLKTAQALGDRQALLDAGRSVIRFDLGSSIEAGLRELTAIVMNLPTRQRGTTA